MNELIKITTNENNERLVDARELHGFLNIGRDFSAWFKDLVETYEFTEGLDFSPVLGKSTGGRPSKDYAIRIDMAKEVSMLARNETGKMARRYFIECEKELVKAKLLLPDFTNPAESARAWATEYEKAKKAIQENKALQIENDEMKPKADFYDDVAGSKDAIELGKVAKVIGIKGMGRNNLFAFLRDKKVLMDKNIPYQKHVDSGYFRVIEQEYSKPDGSNHINIKTLVYQKGVDFILKLLRERAE